MSSGHWINKPVDYINGSEEIEKKHFGSFFFLYNTFYAKYFKITINVI